MTIHRLPDQGTKAQLRRVVDKLPPDTKGYILLTMNEREQSQIFGDGLTVGHKAFLLQLFQHVIQDEIRRGAGEPGGPSGSG